MSATRRRFGLVLAAGVLAATPARPQSARHPRVTEAIFLIETWLDAQRAYQRIPGLSAAVVRDQELVWSGGFGLADLERKAAATPTTLYSICSISKLFTSLGVLQLRDAGKLRLDDPVGKHLPWFNIKRQFQGAPEITIEGLLTHASGLPREADYPYWTGPFTFPTREHVMERLSKQETLYPAESDFQYSNLGLTLAGEVVAAASGQPYEAYVRSHILDPLGLSDTHPQMPESERGRRLATGYGPWKREGERRPLPFFQARGIGPAAGYASTARDLASFASWQFKLLGPGRAEGTGGLGGNGGTGGVEVLSANTLREMQRVHFVDTDFETTWGLGFAVWRSEGKTFVGHGGSCPGYRTELLLKPDEKIATVVMANAIDANAGGLAQRVYEIVSPALKAAHDTTPPKLADPALARYVGTYDAEWGGERQVLIWEGQLAVLDLPSDNPIRALTKLRQAGEHSFRRVGPDDSLGEAWTFEMGPDGRPARLWVHGNSSARIR